MAERDVKRKLRKIIISLVIPQLNALNNEFFFLFFDLAICTRVNKHSAEKKISYIKFPKYFFVSTIFSYINKKRWAAKIKNTRKEQLIDVATIHLILKNSSFFCYFQDNSFYVYMDVEKVPMRVVTKSFRC